MEQFRRFTPRAPSDTLSPRLPVPPRRLLYGNGISYAVEGRPQNSCLRVVEWEEYLLRRLCAFGVGVDLFAKLDNRQEIYLKCIENVEATNVEGGS